MGDFQTNKKLNLLPLPYIGMYDLDLIYQTSDVELLYQILSKVNDIAQSQNIIIDNFEKVLYWAQNQIEQYTKEQLEDWLNDGTITNIILSLGKVLKFYKTTIEMINDTSISVGQMIQTGGYYNECDGGYGIFLITNEIDNNLFQITLENGLYANLINQINSLNIGCGNCLIQDNYDKVYKALTICKNKKMPFYIKGVCYIEKTIDISGVKIIGEMQPNIFGIPYIENGVRYGDDYAKHTRSVDFITYIKNNINGSAIVSDIANPIITCGQNKGLQLSNVGIYGWLLNYNQIGITTYKDMVGLENDYQGGSHYLEHVTIANCGNTLFKPISIELSTFYHCIFALTNGYCIQLEMDNTDIMLEYTVFDDCKFMYSRLDGIYLKNIIRKNNIFKHCQFQSIGQYNLGDVNDIYGRRYIDNIDNAKSGIFIDGTYQLFNQVSNQLTIKECYGEVLQKLLKIKGNIFNNINVDFSYMSSYVNEYSALLDITLSYCNQFISNSNSGNYGNFMIGMINECGVSGNQQKLINVNKYIINSLPLYDVPYQKLKLPYELYRNTTDSVVEQTFSFSDILSNLDIELKTGESLTVIFDSVPINADVNINKADICVIRKDSANYIHGSLMTNNLCTISSTNVVINNQPYSRSVVYFIDINKIN